MSTLNVRANGESLAQRITQSTNNIISGKLLIKAAIENVNEDAVISDSPTFQELADNINQLSGGGGTIIYQNYPLNIEGDYISLSDKGSKTIDFQAYPSGKFFWFPFSQKGVYILWYKNLISKINLDTNTQSSISTGLNSSRNYIFGCILRNPSDNHDLVGFVQAGSSNWIFLDSDNNFQQKFIVTGPFSTISDQVNSPWTSQTQIFSTINYNSYGIISDQNRNCYKIQLNNDGTTCTFTSITNPIYTTWDDEKFFLNNNSVTLYQGDNPSKYYFGTSGSGDANGVVMYNLSSQTSTYINDFGGIVLCQGFFSCPVDVYSKDSSVLYIGQNLYGNNSNSRDDYISMSYFNLNTNTSTNIINRKSVYTGGSVDGVLDFTFFIYPNAYNLYIGKGLYGGNIDFAYNSYEREMSFLLYTIENCTGNFDVNLTGQKNQESYPANQNFITPNDTLISDSSVVNGTLIVPSGLVLS